MERISRHKMFMQMAEVASRRSTCFRGNVGAVITMDNNVISIGYNGPKAGEEHCKGNKCKLTKEGGCSRAVHAETNAMLRADKVSMKGATLYCTHAPCYSCARYIVGVDIETVFYMQPYRNNLGLQLLQGHEIDMFKITPSGYIINTSGEIVDEKSLQPNPS